MKTLRATLALVFLAGHALRAQEDVPPPAPPAAAESRPVLTAEALEQLLAPIALYPDALIALILPASTAPADIVLAARHVRDNPGDRSQIEHRAWDESVKSLTSYPDLLKWLDENLQWTKQVGEAFMEQPAEVMQAIQRLRTKARAAGTLVDTPQQQVIADADVIRIVPAQPDIIYVPSYEPQVVFVERPVYYSRPYLTFGVGVAVGSWLAYDCDWRRRVIWCGDRHRRWTGHNWRQPLAPPPPHGRITSVRQWHPPPRTSVHLAYTSRGRPDGYRPSPRPRLTGPDYRDRPLPAVPAMPGTPQVADLPGPRAQTGIVRAPTGHLQPQTGIVRPQTGAIRPQSGAIRPPSAALAAPPVISPLPLAGGAPQPATVAPPRQHRYGGDRSRDDGGSRRTVVAPPLPAATMPLPVAPPAPAMGPTVSRSFARTAPAPAPAGAMPMSRQAAPAAVTGPTAPAAAPAQAAPRGGWSRGSDRNANRQEN